MRLVLPPHYSVERAADHQALIGPNQRTVAVFTPAAQPHEIERAACEHRDRVNVALGRLEDALQAWREVRREGRREGQAS